MRVKRFAGALLFGAMAVGCIVCGAPAVAQAEAPKDGLKPPVKRSLYNERVTAEFHNATVDTALQQLLEPTPFNYLYATGESPADMSAHLNMLPMKTALDMLAKGNAYRWDVVDNVLVAWQEKASPDLPDHRKYSAHVRLTPFSDVLGALNSVHPFRYRFEGDPNVQVVEAKFARLEFDEALAAILKQCETPMKCLLVGRTLVLSPDKTLPTPKKEGVEAAPIIVGTPLLRPRPEPPADGIKRYDLNVNGSLEDVLNILFRIGRRTYRIAPTVADPGAKVVLDKKGLKFDEMLAALMAAVPGQTPLTYRMDKDVYVIEPKGDAGKNSEIVFPSVPGDKAVRSEYVLENRPIGEALRLILDPTGENYMFGVPDNDKTVTLHLKNATVSEAVQAALRAAEIPRHFQLVKDRGGYGLAPARSYPPVTDAELKTWKFSAKFHDAPAFDAFNIAFSWLGNYTLDESLQIKKVRITASFQDRTFEQMLTDLAHSGSSGISIEYKDRQMKARAL